MKTVTFGRHGQAKANEEGLLAGSRTDSPLTPRGEQDAHELADHLADTTVDLLVTSPLKRASMTANIVAKDIAYKGEIVEQPLFIERDFGSATNMPKSQAFDMLDNGTATEVETVAEFGERARRALDWLRRRPESHILVIGHAAFGQMLGTIAVGGNPEDFLAFDNLSNGGVFRVYARIVS